MSFIAAAASLAGAKAASRRGGKLSKKYRKLSALASEGKLSKKRTKKLRRVTKKLQRKSRRKAGALAARAATASRMAY
jgi:hypothetical protein